MGLLAQYCTYFPDYTSISLLIARGLQCGMFLALFLVRQAMMFLMMLLNVMESTELCLTSPPVTDACGYG